MTAGGHLSGFVTLRGDDRKLHTFGPGDDVPAWARQRITNPSAWSGDEQAPAPAPSPSPPPAAPVTPNDEGDQGDGHEGDEDDEDHEPPAAVVAGDEPPPRGGRGSGAPAWRAYAAAHGVTVADDASREDVIMALEAADIRTD